MRLGDGRMGGRRRRAFVPLFERGLSVWTVTCLRICWQLKKEGRGRKWLILALVINASENL